MLLSFISSKFAVSSDSLPKAFAALQLSGVRLDCHKTLQSFAALRVGVVLRDICGPRAVNDLRTDAQQETALAASGTA